MKKYKILLSLTALVLIMATLASCSAITLRVRATELSAGYTRKTVDDPALSESMGGITGSMTDVSLAMFRNNVTNDGQNKLISPLSAVLCLAMIANGADGNTRSQIEHALGMSIDQLNRCLLLYSSSLDKTDITLAIANSAWIRSSFAENVKESFLQANADWYGAQIYSADFDSSTVRDINSWVKNNTDGLIDSIIDQVPDNAVMYLINTLLFEAKWQMPYEKDDIRDGRFNCYNGSTTEVKMMCSEENVYMSSGGAQAFARNYRGGKYSFIGILPDKDTDIYSYIASLDSDAWRALWDSRDTSRVEVSIPEFECEDSIDLTQLLRSLGITDMFGANADFSGITDAELYCGSMCQKVKIEVDRNGTKATAISWSTNSTSAEKVEEPKIITLDRPFVYAVVDNSTGLPLFIGTVINR